MCVWCSVFFCQCRCCYFCECFDLRKKSREKNEPINFYAKGARAQVQHQIDRIVRSTLRQKMFLFSHSGASTTISILCFSTKFSIHLFMTFFVPISFLILSQQTNVQWQNRFDDEKNVFLISFFIHFLLPNSARNVLTSKFVVFSKSLFPREIAMPPPLIL